MAKQYTKQLIQKKFIELLNERKLNKITVHDVAQACEINRNTFYYYYSNIYEVLTELFQREIQKVADEYKESRSWEESFLVATQFIQNNRAAVYHIYNSIRRVELENYIFDISGNVMYRYVDTIAKETQATEEDKKIIARFYKCALTDMVMRWIDDSLSDEPVKVITRIGQLFDGNILMSLKRSEELTNNV
jgi:AcrR family transcriptional regulator